MQWLIQCTDLPDSHTSRLLEEVKKRNLPFLGVGSIPFTDILTGFEEANESMPSMFYGSVQMTARLSKMNYKPGVFYQEDWFDPRSWLGKRSDLLNEEAKEISVAELRLKWVDEPMWVKSVKAKQVTGMVIEPEKEDKDTWLIEHSDLDGNDILVIAPALNIATECRFFVVKGEVVTGSTYRWLGCRTIRHPIDLPMWDFVRGAVKEWLPHDTIVIDACQLKNGKFKIIEFNAINSSGFYNCDVGAIVDKLEQVWG